MNLKILPLSILLVILAGTAIYLNINNDVGFMANNSNPSPPPGQAHFFELTIPYLRNREYRSELSELEMVEETEAYISYLTNYKSDSLKVNGLLTLPKGNRPEGGWPAVVFVHGYIPPTQYQTLTRYNDHVDYLARNGLVVFKIDLRGHGDSEGEPGGGYYSSDYVIDTLNAVAALQSSDFVNKDKIGLWGHSMAGNVTLRAFTAKPELKALVVWGGVGFTYTDINTYGIDDNSYQPPMNNTERQRRRQQLRDLYGDAKDGNPFWKQVAPTEYLKDLKGAISLHHAVDDTAASIEYSRNLNNLLNDTSIPHEFNEYQSGGHNLTDPTFTTAMERTVDFYKKYLGE